MKARESSTRFASNDNAFFALLMFSTLILLPLVRDAVYKIQINYATLNRGSSCLWREVVAIDAAVSLIIFSLPFTHLSIFPVHAALRIPFFRQFIFRLSVERSIFFSPRKQASVLHNPCRGHEFKAAQTSSVYIHGSALYHV